MPDATLEAPEKKSVLDQYDLSEDPTPSETTPQQGDSTPSAADIPASESAPSRPRNPDGSFAKPSILVRRALDLGFTQDEINETPAADLRELIHDAAQEKLFKTLGTLRERSPAAESDGSPPSTSPAPPSNDFDLGISEEDVHPTIFAAFSTLKKEFLALRQRMDQVQGIQQTAISNNLTQRADKIYQKYPDIFGDKAFGALGKDSDELARRRTVANRSREMPGESVEDRLEAAIKQLYPTVKGSKGTAATAEATPEVTEEDWNEGTLARPTHRNGSYEPDGVEKAKRAVRQQVRDQGYDRTPASKDDFPG